MNNSNNTDSSPDHHPTIQLRGIDCVRGNKPLLTNVNMDLTAGSVTALIGPNGTGKSTLISTITGDIKPRTGEITLNTTPIHHLPNRSTIFGLLTETHGLPQGMKTSTIITYWTKIHSTDPKLRDTLIHRLGVNTFLKTTTGKLSTGMRRRLELVLALLPDPQTIILDEPFNGLDLKGIQHLRTTIGHLRDDGKTVLLATHTLNEVDQLADQTYAIHDNRLIKLEFTPKVAGASEAAYTKLRERNNPHEQHGQ